jgi:hypothetical protein
LTRAHWIAVERALWAGAVLLFVYGSLDLRVDRSIEPSPIMPSAPIGPPAILPHNDGITAAARALLAGNPFRFDRTYPERMDDPAHDRSDVSDTNGSGLDALPLFFGVVGPPFRAVVAESEHSVTRVVQSGETIGDFTVQDIHRNALVLSRADSTVTLTLRRPW